MPKISTTLCVIAAAMTCAVPARVARGQDMSSDHARAFLTATHEYAAAHRRLEAQIGPIQITTSIADINRNIELMAAAIRAERRDAKQGDLFTPDLAIELRAVIHEALRHDGFTPNDLINASRIDGIDYDRVGLRVNDRFPWALGVAMFPGVIAALPPLPPELQYRIVGADLVLIDVHASLIVDILPAAVAELTIR